MELSDLLKFALVYGPVVVGSYFLLPTVIYVCDDLPREIKVKMAMKKQKFTDSSGLVGQVLKLESRSFLDDNTPKEENLVAYIPVAHEAYELFIDVPKRFYETARHFLNGTANILRLFLQQSEDNKIDVTLALRYDEGLKTSRFSILKSQRESLFEDLRFLESLGYKNFVFG